MFSSSVPPLPVCGLLPYACFFASASPLVPAPCSSAALRHPFPPPPSALPAPLIASLPHVCRRASSQRPFPPLLPSCCSSCWFLFPLLPVRACCCAHIFSPLCAVIHTLLSIIVCSVMFGVATGLLLVFLCTVSLRLVACCCFRAPVSPCSVTAHGHAGWHH